MRVERVLPAASQRLITIGDDASLTDAAKLLREPDSDLVVVCNGDKRMVGVITKTDIVRQVGQRRESEFYDSRVDRHDADRRVLPAGRSVA